VAIERAPEIERLVRESHEVFIAGDVDALARMTSRHPSALMIGSDPDEVWKGHEAIVGALKVETGTARERDFKFVPGETTAYADGDVGWAMTLGAFHLADGTELPTRSMSVLHREDGEWKFLQGSFSLAVPNSALEVGSALARELVPAP
jgi:ketosteroid isomerase-like protein